MDDERWQLEEALREAKAINRRTDLTDRERDDLVKKVERIEQLRKAIDEQDRIKEALHGLPGDPGDDGQGNGLYAALKAAGFQLGRPGTITEGAKAGAYEVPFSAITRGYKSDLIATQTDAAAESRQAPSPLGVDGRHVFPFIPQTPISLQETKISFLKQTTRTLPTVASMQLAIDSAATKPVTDTVATLVTAEPVWVATISNPQPNILFGIPALRQLLDADMSLAYRNSVDDLVLDAIDAATTNTRAQGTDLVGDAIYLAAQDVIDDGFNPQLVIMGTTIASVLALTKDGNDRYNSPFAAGNPLEKLTPVVNPQASATKIFVVDPTVTELFRSPVAFEANSALYFESNRTVARVEGLAYAAVRQGNGICELTLA